MTDPTKMMCPPFLNQNGDLIGHPLEMKLRDEWRKISKHHGVAHNGVLEADLVRAFLAALAPAQPAPCGECFLPAGETCDICGRVGPSPKAAPAQPAPDVPRPCHCGGTVHVDHFKNPKAVVIVCEQCGTEWLGYWSDSERSIIERWNSQPAPDAQDIRDWIDTLPKKPNAKLREAWAMYQAVVKKPTPAPTEWNAAIEAAANALQAAQNVKCDKCGHPRNAHQYRHPFVSSESVDGVATILALRKGGAA